jgi:hypothetical protein
VLVLDPCYRNSRIETLAAALPCAIEWHPGFRMPASRIEDCVSYRGPDYAELARRLMVDGYVTPLEIGSALKHGLADPISLKRVWHCVARFGRLD